MRHKVLMAVCAFSMFLSGCGSSSVLLNKYSEMAILGSSDVLSLVDPDKGEGFAEDLAVISVEDNEASVNDSTITAPSALLIQTNTNDVLYSKNVYESLAPASLTKLMTALLVLKYGNLDDEITFTEEMLAVDNPAAQMAGFAVGDKVSVRDLFYAMLIYSGNDTSNALGIYISGTIEEFAQLMNSEAKKLGANHTNYVNACGLDAQGHETCAYDLYLMFNECLKYEEFCDAVDRSSYTFDYTNASGQSVSKTLETTNLYLAGQYEPPEGIHIIGGKTGTTENAGTCLILNTEDGEGNTYISLVLGSSDKPELYQQMSNLLSIIQKK